MIIYLKAIDSQFFAPFEFHSIYIKEDKFAKLLKSLVTITAYLLIVLLT